LADTEKKCDICGKAFENSDKLNKHNLESHKNEPAKVRRVASQSSRYKATGIAAAIAIALVVGVYFSENQSSPRNPIQGVECEPVEALVFHIHAHLDVMVDGKSVTVPAGIGIKPNVCFYWLHTHDTSGVIHIESPREIIFTLAQFIEVWDNTPGISPSFEEATNGDTNLKVFVNGTEVKDGFDKIQLAAHDEIVIISGNIPPSIPSYYEFGGL